ncbi:MAG: hypothetical protein AB7G23_02935 [Vicinamibacterales bacterium]
MEMSIDFDLDDLTLDDVPPPHDAASTVAVATATSAASGAVLPTALRDEPLDLGDLVLKKEQIVARAEALATGITDQATCDAASAFAVAVDDLLRAVHEQLDPLVAEARAPYQRRLDERKALVEPLEAAKSRLIGRQGAVTLWVRQEKERQRLEAEAEQRRLDAEAAKERQRLEAEAAEQRKVAEAAVKAGDMATAAQAVEQAREATHRADTTIARTATVAAPKASGTTTREDWTYELALDGGNAADALRALVVGIAKPLVLRELISHLQTIPGWQTATGAEIVNAIDFLEGQQPEIPVTAVQENGPYLRTRAKADKDTLKWPGVRFFDAGTVVRRARR